MNTVESVFKKYVPEYPIISGYVDEADAKKFEDERRTGIQSALFGGMAILISCLGLFALAAYTAEKQNKGNRDTESAGCIGIGHYPAPFQRFRETGGYFLFNCISRCLVDDE